MVIGLLQPPCVAGRDQRSGRLVIERVSEFSGLNELVGVVDGTAAVFFKL